ncbi:MAG: hypothetical protein K6C68_13260 [Ruminococcus sp.]|nr:hypothetical protein [Ruminococcus sp.]
MPGELVFMLILGGLGLLYLLYKLIDVLDSSAARSNREYEERKRNELLEKVNVNGFHTTKKIGDYVYIDDINKKIKFSRYGLDSYSTNFVRYNYSDILNYQLIEDGNTVIQGGADIGRAVAGGLLFGGAGAVIGGTTGEKTMNPICTKLEIKITIKSINAPTEYISLISSSTDKSSSEYSRKYRIAQDIISTLDVIISSQ